MTIKGDKTNDIRPTFHEKYIDIDTDIVNPKNASKITE
jgi:hypothetical protein